MSAFLAAGGTLAAVLAVASRGDIRAILLGLLCVVSLNNLALPFHALPFGGGRVLATAGIAGLAILLFSVRDIREGDRGMAWLARAPNAYNAGLVLLLMLMVAYVLLTPDVDYGLAKTRTFFLSVVFPATALSIFAPFERRDLRIILIALAVASLLVAVQITFSPQEFGDWRFRRSVSSDIHPNNVARNIGLGVPILLGGILFGRRLRVSAIAGVVGALGLLLAAMLLTGSRGPITAAAVAMVGLVLFRVRHFLTLRAAARLLVVCAAVGAAGAVLFDRYIHHQPTWARIAFYFETFGQNASDLSRLGRYATAWNGFIDSKLVGVGTGGFTWLWTGPPPGGIFDGRDYPHNFVLEAFAELGLPGGLLVLVMTVGVALLIVRRIRASRGLSNEIGILAALWCYAVVNSSLSGDLATNYQMWVLGAMVYLAVRGVPGPEAETVSPRPVGSSATDIMPPPPGFGRVGWERPQTVRQE